jgi:hypothetical protein
VPHTDFIPSLSFFCSCWVCPPSTLPAECFPCLLPPSPLASLLVIILLTHLTAARSKPSCFRALDTWCVRASSLRSLSLPSPQSRVATSIFDVRRPISARDMPVYTFLGCIVPYRVRGCRCSCALVSSLISRVEYIRKMDARLRASKPVSFLARVPGPKLEECPRGVRARARPGGAAPGRVWR